MRLGTITEMAVEWLTIYCVHSGDTVSNFDRVSTVLSMMCSSSFLS